jgi:hypothetical protein
MKALTGRDRKRLERLVREPQAPLKAGETDVIRAYLTVPATTGVLRCAELSGVALCSAILTDRDAAVAMGVLAARSPDAARILRRAADLIDQAADRVRLALTARNDVDDIRAEVERRVGTKR